MATKKKSRNPGGGADPGRLLLLLLALLIAGGATMIGTGSNKPKLAIDLDGGTQVTLTAKTINTDDPNEPGGKLTAAAMKEAVKIIRKRVNGFGVSEAQVTTLGKDNIVVAVPGSNSGDEATKVGQTALLRFRPVLRVGPPNPTTAGDITAPGGIPGLDDIVPGAGDAGDQERPISAALTADPTDSPSPAPSATTKASASPSSSAKPSAEPTKKSDEKPADASEVPAEVTAAFFKLDCTKPDANRIGDTKAASDYVVACDRDNTGKFLLGPSEVQGTQVSSADAGLPGGVASVGAWQVNLSFNGQGTKDFAAVTKKLAGQQQPFNQLAITLDGVVQSAPTVNEEIPTGQAQISGSFTQEDAQDLANVLKYGALPLAFTQSKVESVSATLGDDQLNAGLLAGALGMALVIAYGLFYYRGLGVAALLGLGLAAIMAYMAVSLLGEAMGYRLSIAGIAGLIVAIGITADSFVVYFERLRDEIREGRTPRVAVEQGWRRAKRTILTANFVSLLASAVLYYFSVADVKGFAFTLGVVTIIDVVVIFLFTKPLVTLMMRRPYFARGGRWSGVSAESLGIRRPVAQRTVIKEA